MASTSLDDNKELPVIWLLPPPGLQPPKHSFQTTYIAIGASVAVFLIILALTLWCCKKRKAIKKAKERARRDELKKGIRVVHPPSLFPDPYRANTSSEMFRAFQVEDYHEDSAHKPTQVNAAATSSSPPRISYNIPSYYENAGASNDHADGFVTRPLSFFRWRTPSSSIYSGSGLYPAPLVISKSCSPDKVSGGGNKQDGNWV